MSGQDKPRSLPELLAAFDEIAGQIIATAEAMQPADWVRRPAEDAWHAGQLLDHLVRSVGPVARSYAAPKRVLLRRFGAPENASREFDAIQAVYLSELAGGAAAAGPFLPEPDASPADVLAGWRETAAEFRDQLAAWSEDELDAHQLPHPLIGMLTMREMAMFTVYHCRHHYAEILDRESYERRERSDSETFF